MSRTAVPARWAAWFLGLALACAAAPSAAQSGAASSLSPSPEPVSASAQRVYERARGQLVQIRTLLQGQTSQSTVGSGFIVSDDGLLMTNYHVVSQAALQPSRYRLVYTRAEGGEGPLELLAFDAVHDLALLRAADGGLAGRGALTFRSPERPLGRGERIFSLGNPLDVGFAVLEGNYSGLVERSFYPNIFFAGSLNPGMSGGPALDERGEVIGVNVATRRDGQQVSFLVPGAQAQALLARAAGASVLNGAIHAELTAQLMSHQQQLTERFLAQPWRSAHHDRYRIPVPEESFLRCWGQSSPSESKGLQYERSDCEMGASVFVGEGLFTGGLSVRHEAYDGAHLGPWRFSAQYSASFKNEHFPQRSTRHRTAAQCRERFVDRDGLALRAVLCLSAYKRLTGLYDLSLLVATLDQSTAGVQGRFDVRGVSFDNAMRLAEHYLEGYAWKD